MRTAALILIFAATHTLGISAEKEPTWDFLSKYYKNPLSIKPKVEALKGLQRKVRVTNVGDEVLFYFGYSREYPRHYVEKWEDEKWKRGWYNWCGTGIRSHKLEPGESVEMKVSRYKVGGRQRILTVFHTSKKKQGELIPLVIID